MNHNIYPSIMSQGEYVTINLIIDKGEIHFYDDIGNRCVKLSRPHMWQFIHPDINSSMVKSVKHLIVSGKYLIEYIVSLYDPFINIIKKYYNVEYNKRDFKIESHIHYTYEIGPTNV